MEATLRDEAGEVVDPRGDYWQRVTLALSKGVGHRLSRRLNRAQAHGGNVKAILKRTGELR